LEQIIYLIRHGETVFNSQGRYQGEMDSPLTADGIEQVENIAKLLKINIDTTDEWEVISSPLGRAQRSTEIICDILGWDVKKINIDDRLKEVSVGSWAGLTTQEIKASWPELINQTNHYNWYFNSPDGESYMAVVKRATEWLNSIKNKKKVIVVSHGLTSRIIRGVYGQLETDQTLRLEVSQTTFFKLTNHTIERFCCEYEEF
jgi:broad specificity phosphatase PhoE